MVPEIVYTKSQHATMNRWLADTRRRKALLIDLFSKHEVSSLVAKEHIVSGLLHRLETVDWCVQKVFKISPPAVTLRPNRNEILDLEVYLQSFVLNILGATDNLAWLLVEELPIRANKVGDPLKNRQIGLGKGFDKVRRGLPGRLRDYLTSIDDWLDHIADYRYAITHRIPLQIPPYGMFQEDSHEANKLKDELLIAIDEQNLERIRLIDAELCKVARFVPVMKHSFLEKSQPHHIHPRIVLDFSELVLLGAMVLLELGQSFEGFEELVEE